MEEAYHIIQYLSNNPISYIDLSCAVPNPSPEPSQPSPAGTPFVGSPSHPTEKRTSVVVLANINNQRGTNGMALDGDWGSGDPVSIKTGTSARTNFTVAGGGSGQIFQQAEVVNVDISAAREARKLAMDAEEGCNNLLVSLQSQAGTCFRSH